MKKKLTQRKKEIERNKTPQKKLNVFKGKQQRRNSAM
jgi:hypothetical protein